MSGVPQTNRGTGQATRQQLDELDALLKRMLDLPVNRSEPEPPDEVEDYVPPPRPARPEPVLSEPPRPAARRSYPASYMVVETSTPPGLPRESTDDGLGPRKVERPPEPLFEERLPPKGYQTVDPSKLPQPGDEDWVPLRSSWQPSAQTWKPLAEAWDQSRDAVPAAPPLTIPEPPRDWSPTPPNTVGQPVIPPPPAAMPTPLAAPRTPVILLPAVAFNKVFDGCLTPLGPLGKWFRGRAGRGFLGSLGLLAMAAAAAVAVADGIGWPR